MQTLFLFMENKIGILEKVITVLTRNRVNISRLQIVEQAKGDLSLLTLSAGISKEIAEKLRLQLMRIIEVAEVNLLHNEQNI